MRKGFTLLELVIVIIILGVLATLGISQYMKQIEKSRGAEARDVLGQMRNLAYAFRMANNGFNGGTSITASDLGIVATGQAGDIDAIPGPAAGDCRASHYFWYNFANVAQNSMDLVATRCNGGAGKPPSLNAGDTRTLTLSLNAGGLENITSNPLGQY